MDREELFQKRVLELSNSAYQRGIITFSDFLGLNELHIANSQNYKDLGVSIKSFGGYEFAERQIVAFIPDALSYDWVYPITCLVLRPQSVKFSEPLTHRDYLGAILNLGIDRAMIGDIVTSKEETYVFCQERMGQFLLENLCRIKHTVISVEEITNPQKLPAPGREAVQGTVASVRLDSVTALAFSESRGNIVSYIEGGRVFVNGRQVVSNGYTLKEQDRISVRGKGKFQFDHILSQTKKNRFSILLYRYR